MIVFTAEDLEKYQNNKDWYNLEYLTHNIKCWQKHLKYYSNKNYKRKDKIELQMEQMDKALYQINFIQNLIDSY